MGKHRFLTNQQHWSKPRAFHLLKETNHSPEKVLSAKRNSKLLLPTPTTNKHSKSFNTVILGGREHSSVLPIHCIRIGTSFSTIHFDCSSPHCPWRFDQAQSPQDSGCFRQQCRERGFAASLLQPSAIPPTAASELWPVQEAREE